MLVWPSIQNVPGKNGELRPLQNTTIIWRLEQESSKIH